MEKLQVVKRGEQAQSNLGEESKERPSKSR